MVTYAIFDKVVQCVVVLTVSMFFQNSCTNVFEEIKDMVVFCFFYFRGSPNLSIFSITLEIH